jgi:hypothetical protein
LAAVCEVFFFVATLIAGSTWCPMRAMVLPSAGVADPCEAKANETADAATRASKVILMCFLPDDLPASDTDARDSAPAALRAGTHEFLAMAGGVRLEI